MANDTAIPASGAEAFPTDDNCPPDQLEHFSYDDQIVRMFTIATIFWGLVATLVGLFVAVILVVPWLTDTLPWISFGRVRPLHTNAAIFAFAGNAIFAAVYYSTQRLCKARMWSDALSRLHFWGWQLVIVAAAITLPLGITQSRPFSEFEWPIDLLFAIVWVLCFGINFLMTLIRRRERYMYVALWFYLATIVTVAVFHVINNLAVPAGWFTGHPIYAGVQDALMQWAYGRNEVMFLLIMPFLGLMYYFLPKAAERPIFSYRLSIIHFWSLIFIFVCAGPRYLHYTPWPDWVSTLGMLFGLLLWMPSWGGMLNGLLTLRGAWHKLAADPVLKFFVAGIAFYGWVTLENTVLSIRSVNAFSHYTDWTIAHVHAATLGWNGLLIFGMLYWLLPRLYQAKLWSRKLMNIHFWTGLLGTLLYIVPIYAAGLIQAWRWHALDDTGYLLYPDFVATVEKVVPFWWLRVLGGGVYIGGVVMLGVNAMMTWRHRPSEYAVTVHNAPRLCDDYVDPPIPKDELADAPVLATGSKLHTWSKLVWHRRWERLPVKFTVLMTATVIIASSFVLIPAFVIRANVPATGTVAPYTPLELAGRQLYISEGCYNCHSQMIRPLVAETQRYGDYSTSDEFFYDRPAQWGNHRIGPDLAREGGKRNSFWHWEHFDNPEGVVSGSVMPSYYHLLDRELDFEAIRQLVEAAANLGVPYDEELTNAEELAQEQALRVAADLVTNGGPANQQGKQAIALIAYLQRLGTDRYKTDDAAAGNESDEPSEIPLDDEVEETSSES